MSKRIDQLPTMNPVTGDAMFEVSDEGHGSYKADIGAITTYVGNNVVFTDRLFGGVTGFGINGSVAGFKTGARDQISFPADNAPHVIGYIWEAASPTGVVLVLDVLLRVFSFSELIAWQNSKRVLLMSNGIVGMESAVIDAQSEALEIGSIGTVTLAVGAYNPPDVDHSVGWWEVIATVDGDPGATVIPSISIDGNGAAILLRESAPPPPE